MVKGDPLSNLVRVRHLVTKTVVEENQQLFLVKTKLKYLLCKAWIASILHLQRYRMRNVVVT